MEVRYTSSDHALPTRRVDSVPRPRRQVTDALGALREWKCQLANERFVKLSAPGCF